MKHSLLEFDPETRQGSCAVCGPTKIYKGGTYKGIRQWTCGTRGRASAKAWREANPTPPAVLHRISEVDEDLRTGTCRICGPVKVYKGGSRKGAVMWRCSVKSLSDTTERMQDPLVLRRNRSARFERLYGVTIDQYESMVESQGGLCARCGQKPATMRLAVDHCHVTGAVRMLLCGPCNTWLGRLEAQKENLEADMLYLATGSFSAPILERLRSE